MSALVEVRACVVGAKTDGAAPVPNHHGRRISPSPMARCLALIGEMRLGQDHRSALALMGYARPRLPDHGGAINVERHTTCCALAAAWTAPRCAARNVAYVPQSAAASFNPSQRSWSQVIEVAR